MSPILIYPVPNPSTLPPLSNSTSHLILTMVHPSNTYHRYSTNFDIERASDEDPDFGNVIITLPILIGTMTFCAISIIFCLFVIFRIYKEHKQKQKNTRKLAFSVTERHPVYNLSDDFVSAIHDKGNDDGNQYRIKHTAKPADIHHEDYDVDTMRSWLQNVVKLPKYFDNFTTAGYESMDFIKEIQNMEELQEIGITLKRHCNISLCEIQKLRVEEHQNNMNTHIDLHNDIRVRDSLSSQILIPTACEKLDAKEQPSDNLKIIQDTELMDEMMIVGEMRYKQTLDSNADIRHTINPINEGMDGINL